MVNGEVGKQFLQCNSEESCNSKKFFAAKERSAASRNQRELNHGFHGFHGWGIDSGQRSFHP